MVIKTRGGEHRQEQLKRGGGMRLHNCVCKELTLEVSICRHRHPTDRLPPIPQLLLHLAAGSQDPGPHNLRWLRRWATHAKKGLAGSEMSDCCGCATAHWPQLCPFPLHSRVRRLRSALQSDINNRSHQKDVKSNPVPQGKTQQQQQQQQQQHQGKQASRQADRSNSKL